MPNMLESTTEPLERRARRERDAAAFRGYPGGTEEMFRRYVAAAAEFDRVAEAVRAASASTSPAELRRLEQELEDAAAEVERCQGNIADASRRAEIPEHAVAPPFGAPNTEHRAGRWLATQLRALSGGTGFGGAVTPPGYAAEVLDMLAAESVLLRSGARVIETDREVLNFPHVTADPTASWTAEGATITASDAGGELIAATPRKLAALTQMSNEVIYDSEPAVLDVYGRLLIRSLSLKLDLGAYEGSGTAPEIRGLRNVAGIQTVSMGTNGGAFTNLDPFADAINLLERENARASAIVLHPRTWGALLKLKEQTTGNNKPLLQESAGAASAGVERRLYGVPVYLSSQLSISETQGTASNASSAYVYQADELVVVMRREQGRALEAPGYTNITTYGEVMRVELDSSRLFDSDQSEVRAIMRVDVVVPNPKAVCRIAGIIP